MTSCIIQRLSLQQALGDAAEAHPLGCVYGGQRVQVGHGELHALPLQLFVSVHDAREVRAAPEGVGPRLEGRRGPVRGDGALRAAAQPPCSFLPVPPG